MKTASKVKRPSLSNQPQTMALNAKGRAQQPPSLGRAPQWGVLVRHQPDDSGDLRLLACPTATEPHDPKPSIDRPWLDGDSRIYLRLLDARANGVPSLVYTSLGSLALCAMLLL